jgi:hypothetical protein
MSYYSVFQYFVTVHNILKERDNRAYDGNFAPFFLFILRKDVSLRNIMFEKHNVCKT